MPAAHDRLERLRRDASLSDRILSEFSRLIRKRMGEHAYSHLTIILQDGVPVRIAETHERNAEEFEATRF